MRKSVVVLTGALCAMLLGTARPLKAGDIDDCNNAYGQNSISACSRILKTGRLYGRPLTKKLKAIVLYKRGKALASEGRHRRAFKDLKASVRLNPGDDDAVVALDAERQNARSEASISSGKPPKAAKLSEWEKATAVLKKRGFSASQALGVLQSFSCGYYRTDCAIWRYGDRDQIRLRLIVGARYGLSRKAVDDHTAFDDDAGSRGDIVLDLEHGAYLAGMKPSDAARTVSSCYKSRNFHTACKLRYHQKDGCRLTKNWMKLCRKGMSNVRSMEFCFGDIKGDLPALPSRNDPKSRISLKNAKKKTRIAAVVPDRTQKLPKRAYCTEQGLSG